MRNKEPRPCDMQSCKSNRASGICGAAQICLTSDKFGRPICQTYSPHHGAMRSDYDIQQRPTPAPRRSARYQYSRVPAGGDS